MQTAAPSPNGVYDTISYVYVDDVSVTPVTDATNDTSLCDTVGFSKVLHGYQGGSNYTWNTGDTTPQIIVHTPGTYTYQVTFGSYTIKDTINITYRTRQQLHANLHDTAICAGTTINIKAPDSFVAYEWHANGNVYHTQTVPVFTAGTVVLQATDSCGMMTDSFHVRFIQQQPLAAHINDTMVCAGTNVQFAAPAGYLAYQWHYGNTATTGQSVTITQPGTVILQVSDSCKTYADTFIIHHKQPLPLIHLHDTTICNGATAFVMAQNGYDAYGWQYSGNTYTTQAVMITNAGKVVLHVTDICGTQADSFMVAYKQLYPLTTHLHDTSVCAGTSVQVTAPAGYLSYAWLHDNTVDTKQAATIASDGMVILQVQDSCVTYADSFIVQLKPVPLPPATTDTAICPGAILVSLPVYGSGLLWYTSPSDKNGSVTMPVVPSGQHDPLIIYVTQTVNGCESDKASLRIDFYNEPVVILPTDTVFCSGDRYRIGYEANMPVSYKWSSGETVPFIYPAASGVYQLTVSNMCGSAAASTNMQVAPCDKCFWLPDAFTPNGDGRNDEFGPVRTCPAHFHYYLFKVYNRWGQVVFESVSPEHKWNGSFAGQDQPLGTYSYTLEYRSTAVSPTVFTKGTLELIR